MRTWSSSMFLMSQSRWWADESWQRQSRTSERRPVRHRGSRRLVVPLLIQRVGEWKNSEAPQGRGEKKLAPVEPGF